jgi:hypothetical protein
MVIKIGLVLIALVVVIVGACIIYGRSLVRTGKEKRELHRRRVEDAEREEMFKADAEAWKRGEPPIRIDTPIEVDWGKRKDDDTTKTWPVIDWEKRYAELVEVTAARTDQAKEKDDKLPEGC